MTVTTIRGIQMIVVAAVIMKATEIVAHFFMLTVAYRCVRTTSEGAARTGLLGVGTGDDGPVDPSAEPNCESRRRLAFSRRCGLSGRRSAAPLSVWKLRNFAPSGPA